MTSHAGDMLVRTAIRRNRDSATSGNFVIVDTAQLRPGGPGRQSGDRAVGRAALRAAGSRQGGGAARAGPVSFEVGSFRHLYRDCAIAVRDGPARELTARLEKRPEVAR